MNVRFLVVFGCTCTLAGALAVLPLKSTCVVGAAPYLQNGDCNGDGLINIADAICILNYLFNGGDSPQPIDCYGLPATGQTECYDNLGNTVTCASPMCPGQDGAYLAGCPNQNRFSDNGDGTVTDSCTGLMWQKKTADINGDGSITPIADEITWCQALTYCDDLILCNDGTWTTNPQEAQLHGGVKYDDWRLPNVYELHSLVDYGRVSPAIDPVFATKLTEYWTSTTTPGESDHAMDVLFQLRNLPEGVVDNEWKDDPDDYVRAVRSN